MKRYLLILILVTPLFSFAQDYSDNEFKEDKYKIIKLSNYKTHGYYHKTRLDSIPSIYATVNLLNIIGGFSKKVCYFCVGDTSGKTIDERFFDIEGNFLKFNDLTSILNFLDFNGWTLKEIINDNYKYSYTFQSYKKEEPIYLFTKK